MDKRLKLFAISLTSLISATTLGIGVSHFSDNIAFITRASEKITEITLDYTEQPEIDNDGNGTLSYSKNNHASFSYTGASDFETGHVSLANGGTIVKNQESKDLITFKAIFTGGSLKLQTGYTGIGAGDVCYEYTLTSGTTFDVGGNYFKLISTGATNISEIEIVFGCEKEVDEPTHSYDESTWTTNETHHWHACTDEHCVRKGDEASHTFINVPQVNPTETETGFTAGTVCSVCGYVKSGREILPVLDEVNYHCERHTTKVGDVVADFDKYTWVEDDSVIIYTNPGDPIDNYIHAGSSYYSIETWNDIFKNQESVVTGEGDNRTLTMTLDGETTVLAEDRESNLDGTFDLLHYKNVVINGNGTLNITYTENQDGIKCHNLTIGNNVTLNLIGNDPTAKTGVSFAGTLQIDGIYKVSNFGNGIGINTDINASATDNIIVNGELRITDCMSGIHAWNTPSGGASINVNGKLTMTNITNQGMYLGSAVTVNFNEGCSANITAGSNAILKSAGGATNFNGGEVNLVVTGSSDGEETEIGNLNNVALQTNNAAAINFNGGVVNITSGDIGIKTTANMGFTFQNEAVVNIKADKVGIYAARNTDDDNNKMSIKDKAKLTVISENGTGIYCENGGRFFIQGDSTLDITAASSGIYHFKLFRAFEGSKSDPTVITASIIIRSGGLTGDTGGKTPEGHAMFARTTGYTDIGFATTGTILIKNTSSTTSRVGIHAGNTGGGTGNFIVKKCSNFTIENFSTAMAITTSNPNLSTISYVHDTDNEKIDIVNCTNVSSGYKTFTNVFKSSTCNIINS